MSQPILPDHHLEKRMGPWSALALNMSNMIGVGPFITLPALMATLGGPQSILGWAAALVITLPDALVWSELGAAMPASGGTYKWLRVGYGAEDVGAATSLATQAIGSTNRALPESTFPSTTSRLHRPFQC